MTYVDIVTTSYRQEPFTKLQKICDKKKQKVLQNGKGIANRR